MCPIFSSHSFTDLWPVGLDIQKKINEHSCAKFESFSSLDRKKESVASNGVGQSVRCRPHELFFCGLTKKSSTQTCLSYVEVKISCPKTEAGLYFFFHRSMIMMCLYVLNHSFYHYYYYLLASKLEPTVVFFTHALQQTHGPRSLTPLWPVKAVARRIAQSPTF